MAQSVRSAEEEIMMMTARALESSNRASASWPAQTPANSSIARSLMLIEASAWQSPLLPDLCQAAGASEHMLRNISQEYFRSISTLDRCGC